MTVFELLTENGLDDFYRLGSAAGAPVQNIPQSGQYRFLDEPVIRGRLVHFNDGRTTRVTFKLPAIHCIACVWLLENLFRLKRGLADSKVNFPRRELTVTFANSELELSDLASLLAGLGYAPELSLSDLDRPQKCGNYRLWMQLGVAGFAFGNIMLFSIPGYLGLEDSTSFQRWFGYVSFALAGPVVLFSAQDYWRSAYVSLRRKLLNIEVPIALGLIALFTLSSIEVFSGRGPGYFDSLAGLVFFLLCGRWFQQRSYERLAFDRDYKSFFPLSVTRLRSGSSHSEPASNGELEQEQVALSQVETGDRLIIRHGELLPADARLRRGTALLDYSFVTGESDPVVPQEEELLFAGGRQMGASIEVESIKPVSQSYLASLWNQTAFRKERADSLRTLTNRFSRWFTIGVIAIAVGAALFWSGEEPSRAIRSFIAVLIVACPCALALAAPFSLGTAQRLLGRSRVFLRNTDVLESLAEVDTVVFDKTGTLTLPGGREASFSGEGLSGPELAWVASVSRQSTHPLASQIGQALGPPGMPLSFRAVPGQGLQGEVDGHEVCMGSEAWLRGRGIDVPEALDNSTSSVHIALDGQYRGRFMIQQQVRPEVEGLLRRLAARFQLALLSGDRSRNRGQFEQLFGGEHSVHFEQSPQDKMEFVEALQREGQRLCMVGDGLNDAGALRQSQVGVAVVERMGMFSPASDVIMPATQLPRLDAVFKYARVSLGVVMASFALSLLYNAVGIFFAARGVLSPLVCAVLMPVSSVTVVAFASGATAWLGRRMGWGGSHGGEMP